MTIGSKLILKSAFDVSAFDEGLHNITASTEIDTMPIKVTFTMQQGELYFDTTQLYEEERHGGRQLVTEGVTKRSITMPKVKDDDRVFELVIARLGNDVGFELREKVNAPEPTV